jgi:UDP-N-acetylmuramate dehydrogenase
MSVLGNVPLAPHTTLGVGGRARFLVPAGDEDTVLAALDWARARGLACRVLGGGSNLVVGDAGVDDLVLKVELRGRSARPTGGAVELTVAAGEPWDDVVRHAVEQGWAGLECLSGIPGLAGATPIQNVGAYGQEVSDTVTSVRAVDTETRRVITLAAADCGFAYRDSLFRSRAPGRHVVLAVTYRLAPGGAPTVRYRELHAHLGARGIASPTLADVRESVLAIRRSKSMVIDAADPADPNRRSCGSFFVNPVVAVADVPGIEAAAPGHVMPRWPQPDGRVKIPAAWLIEQAGFKRGWTEGPVGLSTRHALAIVAHEGARASDVVAFARRVQRAVAERFGVRLTPEPVFWGVATPGGLPS